jgi:predicted AlkP superfamily pyrophosphatase or phosphodiesterase
MMVTLLVIELVLRLVSLAGGQLSPPPVVLVSIDGLKPAYVIDADRYRLKIPHLRRLYREGAAARQVTGVLPTVTYPSHTTLLTGVSPERHGIIANTPFDPLGRNQGGWYWYAEDIRVPTLWEACRRAGLKTASVDWPVSVGAPVDWNIVQMWRTGAPDDRKLIRALSTPGLLAEAEAELGSYPEGYDYTVEADLRRAEFNAWLLEKKRPRFQTVYFAGLDSVQHEHGPDSPEALAALERIDVALGRVMAAAGRAVVAVVSDHGFLPLRSEVRLNAALRQAGLITTDERGRVVTWRAITWGSGGSGAVMLRDPADNEARLRVRQLLERMVADPAGGLLAFYAPGDPRRAGSFPEAEFVVGTRPEFYLGGGLDGPVVQPLRRGDHSGGGHGFLPTLPAMDSAFLIAGPGIPVRDLGRIDMRDIAPTLAALLGVALPDAEGRQLFEPVAGAR